MDKEVIKVRQSIAIILLFVTGEFSILASGLAAKKDSWIAVLIAIIFSLMLMFVYLGILKLKSHQNLLDAILNVFGKYIGKIIIVFYTYYFFDLIGLVLRDFVQFAEATSYDKTPIIVPGIFMMILCVWVLKKGLVTLCRWAEFIFHMHI
ncbi:GerAB/ArcD/ProY family transporter [Abyssisolibacter fermentans]|uniref:GerAB/ArcD/ProY family transporter n=1 Tax=Abyssisolibacter fermentans TaxID=1766203 RepID=UPI000833A986|nr:GerAB/ArcD/ProY family transporter [Abyssisolibacter fermentans]